MVEKGQGNLNLLINNEKTSKNSRSFTLVNYDPRNGFDLIYSGGVDEVFLASGYHLYWGINSLGRLVLVTDGQYPLAITDIKENTPNADWENFINFNFSFTILNDLGAILACTDNTLIADRLAGRVGNGDNGMTKEVRETIVRPSINIMLKKVDLNNRQAKDLLPFFKIKQ